MFQEIEGDRCLKNSPGNTFHTSLKHINFQWLLSSVFRTLETGHTGGQRDVHGDGGRQRRDVAVENGDLSGDDGGRGGLPAGGGADGYGEPRLRLYERKHFLRQRGSDGERPGGQRGGGAFDRDAGRGVADGGAHGGEAEQQRDVDGGVGR